MAAGLAKIAFALSELPIFCGRFQTAGHRNLYQSVIQWRHCCGSMKNGFCYRAPFPAKRGNAPGGARVGGTSSGRVGMVCSFSRRCARILSIMSSSSIHAMTLTEPPQRLQTSMSILKTRLSRCAQVIAACRSAAERTSALERGLTPFPRLAGVTSPRHR